MKVKDLTAILAALPPDDEINAWIEHNGTVISAEAGTVAEMRLADTSAMTNKKATHADSP